VDGHSHLIPGLQTRGVPLLEQFVYDLGDPVVNRVAEAGQEFLVRRQVRVEPAWPRAGGDCQRWCWAGPGA